MLLHHKIAQTNLILASKSPRRQQLLRDLGLTFEIREFDVEEEFPAVLKREAIPLYLSKLKAEEAKKTLSPTELLVTADTIVWLRNQVLNKPADAAEARQMLAKLSGQMHEVITAVSLTSTVKSISFYTVTEVWFKALTEEEITYYVDKFLPLDKAGAYGVQEWIGYIGVERINGSYFNVMGLPVKELYEELLAF
jgi:septum formation protein